MKNKNILSVNEAAELLGTTAQTVRVLVKEGKLYAYRLKRTFKIPLYSIKDYMEVNAVRECANYNNCNDLKEHKEKCLKERKVK